MPRNTRGAEGQLIVEELLENWPENETALQEIRERAMDNPLYRNMLLSEDGTITTIIIKTDAYSGGNDEGDVMAGFDDETDLETVATTDERPFLSDAENSELVNAARSITDQYRADDFRIHLAGTPVVADVLKRSMQSNMKRFMLIAIATIAFILALLFRRISGVLMPAAGGHHVPALHTGVDGADRHRLQASNTDSPLLSVGGRGGCLGSPTVDLLPQPAVG